MKILRIEAVSKNDIAVKRNQEIVPKHYYNAIFENKEKEYTATIRLSSNHVAECRNSNDDLVRLKEETQYKLIELINQFNKEQVK